MVEFMYDLQADIALRSSLCYLYELPKPSAF
jgi:hypothetical protein